MTSLDATFREGLNQHLAGQLQAAEHAYRTVLSQNANHPDSLHYLGVIALQVGQPQAAAELIGQSVAIAATHASLNNLGEALRATGRLDEAIGCYRRSIEMMPSHLDAMANLALALLQQKKFTEAEPHLREAMRQNPDHAGAVGAMAMLKDQAGKPAEAVSAWERAVKLMPKNPGYQRSFAEALVKLGDFYGAIIAFRKASELAPKDPLVRTRLAMALTNVGKNDEALAASNEALALLPGHPDLLMDHATILEKLNRIDEGVAELREALTRHPEHPGLCGALSRLIAQQGDLDQAIALLHRGRQIDPADVRFISSLAALHFRRREYPEGETFARQAIAMTPNDPEQHAMLAFCMLAQGKFDEGFREYEWRWRSATFTTKPRNFEQPLWDGSPIAGRRLLVHSEQGFGDIFQFLRYVPLLLARGIDVIVEVPYKIASLVKRMSPSLRVAISGTILPEFDVHVPMLSLPSIFNTSMNHVAAAAPYLRADAALATQWRTWLGPDGPLRVGLVWAGSPKPDPKRSMTLAELVPLGAIPGVTFIAMQSDTIGGDGAKPPEGLTLINVGPELKDFSDTTMSVMANLDVMLTIDTSSAHLAAAMGLRTWVMLPYGCDWRWNLQSDISPWYPTMRLFRQRKADEWGEVVERVRAALKDLVDAK